MSKACQGCKSRPEYIAFHSPLRARQCRHLGVADGATGQHTASRHEGASRAAATSATRCRGRGIWEASERGLRGVDARVTTPARSLARIVGLLLRSVGCVSYHMSGLKCRRQVGRILRWLEGWTLSCHSELCQGHLRTGRSPRHLRRPTGASPDELRSPLCVR